MPSAGGRVYAPPPTHPPNYLIALLIVFSVVPSLIMLFEPEAVHSIFIKQQWSHDQTLCVRYAKMVMIPTLSTHDFDLHGTEDQ
jgi:hypothetical protein